MIINNDLLKFMAEVTIKIFQIIFAMMVVGMFLRDNFNSYIFIIGLLASIVLLTAAVFLYYTGSIREEE